ncbi:interferon-induced, double-stranded RNA-activated protein kinase-like isoform X3 [Hypanus sabinus]|uniref:interferon-induced, double-stranded RNA-activated protein kinase-like isoform X3 n=1 Tax=Hypanus sabinus TaxID=79690 RepID=UPI0028C46190|nr:interferon-induced, double-stranded RNA-activated protein kinase-like isoform X3 [Hypanus sabinus]
MSCTFLCSMPYYRFGKKMANAEATTSDAGHKYVEKLTLYAALVDENLTWEESQSGPSHDPVFIISAKLGNKIYPEAQGKTKKKAKQNAAKNACEFLDLETESEQPLNSSFRTPSPAGGENYVSKLNEYKQKHDLKMWYADNEISTGVAHIQKFSCQVIIDDRKYPEGFGGSKKEAKREAARLALVEISKHPFTFKNLEKSLVDVKNEEEPKENTEGSHVQNSERLTEDEAARLKEMRNLPSGVVAAENSISFTSGMSFRGSTNAVGELNEFCQKKGLSHDFVQVDQRGPSHVPEFTVRCVINGKKFPSATGNNKQDAKRKAAFLALEELKKSDVLSLVSGSKQNRSSEQEDDKCWDMSNSASANPSTPSTERGKGVNPRISMKEFTDKKRIGEGGFGCVYKAKHSVDETYYAIKEIPTRDESTRREAVVLANMEHPNIVRYHTSWFEERDNKTYLYIQMKLYEKNLNVWIQENFQQQRTEDSLSIMRQLLDGVEYIHREKLIHRDLKPANIFLIEGEKLEAKIGDFGLVKVNDQSSHTKHVGTTYYMSPEQLRGDDYNHKVDIFALGLIFFELLWMYQGSESEKHQNWKKIRKGTFPDCFAEQYTSESILIRKMLTETAAERPEAAEVRRGMDSSHAQTI